MADEPDTTKGETSGGETNKAASNDPNINEYGISHGDWDDLSQNQQRDIAHKLSLIHISEPTRPY